MLANLTDLVTSLTTQQAMILRQTQPVCATLLPPPPLPPATAASDPLSQVAAAPVPFPPVAESLSPAAVVPTLLYTPELPPLSRLVLPSLSGNVSLIRKYTRTKVLPHRSLHVHFLSLPACLQLFLISSLDRTPSSQVLRPSNMDLMPSLVRLTAMLISPTPSFKRRFLRTSGHRALKPTEVLLTLTSIFRGSKLLSDITISMRPPNVTF
ncbi:hypothetical protein AXF42_Ash012878 [Apostasia shenzhenica]|uniref:Uncharacterized protein n=1 Tax=Apostasia shenzhenica TaxID=1088818 RepID=A0A2I0ARH6_9ASPA|nr:hypothetical protein AXF42_Ash012878 [Apostasia shenzhenica]